MKTRIMPEDVRAFQYVSAIRFSPDGECVSYLKHETDMENNRYHTRLYLNHGTEAVTRESWDCSGYIWCGNDQLLLAAPGEKGTGIVKVTDLQGNILCSVSVPYVVRPLAMVKEDILLCAVNVFEDEYARLEGLTGEAREKMAEEIAKEKAHYRVLDEYPFWMNGEGYINSKRCAIFTLELTTGAFVRRTPKNFHMDSASYDAQAGVLAMGASQYDIIRPYKAGIYTLDTQDYTLKCLLPQDDFRIEALAAGNGKVVFAGSRLDEYCVSQSPVIYDVNTENGALTPMFSEEISLGNDVCSDARYGSGNLFKIQDGELYFVTSIEDDSVLQKLEDGKAVTLVANVGSIDCFDVHGSKAAYVAMKHTGMQEVYLCDGQEHKLTCWNDAYLEEHTWVHPEKMTFTNREGVCVHGFVLKPYGYDSTKQYPMVLAVHGGPRLTYGDVFYHELQLLSSAGYFVAFANPTGSAGFGQEFGYLCGKFGTIDYDDLMQFTDLVLDTYPCIDRQRLGIMGGSYGGFMTNWVIGHTNRFAAAVSMRSISNWITLEGTSDFGLVLSEGQQLAGTFKDLEKTWWHSPLKYAENAKTPTLFLQSMEDYRCPVTEATQMFTVLKLNHVPSKMCLFYGENHDLSRTGRPHSKIRRQQELMAWFEKYLG